MANSAMGLARAVENVAADTDAVRMVAVGSDGAAGMPLPAGTDRSSTIAAGGTAQPLAAANAARRGLKGQNLSTGDLWINPHGTAVIGTEGSYRIAPGGTWSISTSGAVSIIGATTGQKFSATEF